MGQRADCPETNPDRKKDSGHGRGVETKVTAVRSSQEAGDGFTVARPMDVTTEHESAAARPGGNGLQGSNPASRGSKMADRVSDSAERNTMQSGKEVQRKAGSRSCSCPQRAGGDPQKTELSLAKCSVLS